MMDFTISVVNGTIVLIPPPQGYKVNFTHPTQQHDIAAYIALSVGLPASTFCFMQYLYVKLRLQGKFDTQLACLTIGWIFSVAIQAIAVHTFMIKVIGVHAWEMPILNAETAAYYMVVTPILTAIMTGFCKTSLGLFYCHLSPQKWWKWASWGALFLSAGHNAAIFISILLGCRPFERNWNLTIPGTCINRPALYIITAALNIFSDLVLLVLPIPMIAGLQMPPRQKIGLVFFFAIGSATFITAILRLILLLPTLHLADITWAVSGTTVVMLVESNLLVICAALPTLRRFLSHVAPRFIGDRGSSARSPGNSGAQYQKHSFKTIGGSNNSAKKRVDEFGMTLTEEDICLNTIQRPEDVESQQEYRSYSSVSEVDSIQLRRDNGTHGPVGNLTFEYELWGPRFCNDDQESKCAIVQPQTRKVYLGNRKRLG